MVRFTRIQVVVLVGATVLLTACDQPTEPSGSAALPAPSASVMQQVPGEQTPDQHSLARAIPAFGGLFLEDGVPTAYLTDPSQRGAVEQALAGFLADRGLAASELRVRQGRFSYRQLEDFFERARPEVFAAPGGVFADLDEAANRVTLGVEDAAAAARVRSGVAALGLPDGAVEVEITSPILPMQTLRDRFDPIPAGVQIHFGNYLCSIGIIAEVAGQSYFVTASHCTNHQGGVEGTEYYQPLSSVDGTVIGIEVADPAYYNFNQGPCPYAGAKCRRSDAALVASTGARDYALGSIAEPSGGITWSGGYLNVSGKASGNGIVGDTRHKVGRTTGYTTGEVTASCVDTGVFGSPIVLLCQDWVEAPGTTIVDAGDSGSVVFAGAGNVTWWGILWGGSSDGSTFIYGPVDNVEEELGSLNVTGGGGGPVPPVPPATTTASFTYRCHFSDCSFDASGSTGAGSYDWDFGDGGSDSGVMVSHPFNANGDYNVTLTVAENADGTGTTDTAMQTVACQTKGPNLHCK